MSEDRAMSETKEVKPERRMSAYYYGFSPTGTDEVDKVLSAVACAGKAFHNTGQWQDEAFEYDDHTGQTPVEWIQNAAGEASAHITTLEQRIAELEAAQNVWTYCPECGSEEIHYQEGPHKQCKDCKQEWFEDVDYSTAVKANLARRRELEAAQAWVPVREAELLPGEGVQHHNGNRYQILGVANHYSERQEYPKTVVYRGENGRVWCKTLEDFYLKMEPLPTPPIAQPSGEGVGSE